MKVSHIVDDKIVAFKQGELVATARAVLREHSTAVATKSFDYDSDSESELKRLVSNLFQLHGNEIGDPIQLSLLILFMHGEQYGGEV